MNALGAMFAVITVDDVLAEWRDVSPGTRQTLIIIAAIGLAVAWVVVWVVFLRKPHRRHHRHSHGRHASHAPAREAAAASSDDDSSHHRRRVRVRRPRRNHRPRNPTLAETGGLPPVRTGDPPEILP
jgi:hypothetical protein